jgi:rod shape-determining protein MreD
MTASGSGFGAARPMNPVGWLGLPILLAVAATLFLATPIRIFGLPLPEPVFPLALAFAWALIRPSVLPPFALLLLGLFLDVFWGGPQGLWPLCLLTAYASVLTVRRLITGHEFAVVWLWYGAATAAAFGVGFLLMSMAAGQAPSLVALGWQYLATLILFPFAHRLIERYEDADVRFR